MQCAAMPEPYERISPNSAAGRYGYDWPKGHHERRSLMQKAWRLALLPVGIVGTTVLLGGYFCAGLSASVFGHRKNETWDVVSNTVIGTAMVAGTFGVFGYAGYLTLQALR